MQAFVSHTYSLKERNIYQPFYSELHKRGFGVVAHIEGEEKLFVEINIRQSELFVGIVTRNGNDWLRVQEDWKVAKQKNIPSILIVQKDISKKIEIPSGEVIIFDKRDNSIITALSEKIDAVAANVKQAKPEEILLWILAGSAILLLIVLLAEQHKSKVVS